MEQTQNQEKRIILWQYAAFFAAILLFIPLSLLSLYLADSFKWGLLMILPLHLFIAISSVKNQVSILRLRGRIEYSRGKQAVTYGKIMIAGTLVTAVIILILPARLFFPF